MFVHPLFDFLSGKKKSLATELQAKLERMLSNSRIGSNFGSKCLFCPSSERKAFFSSVCRDRSLFPSFSPLILGRPGMTGVAGGETKFWLFRLFLLSSATARMKVSSSSVFRGRGWPFFFFFSWSFSLWMDGCNIPREGRRKENRGGGPGRQFSYSLLCPPFSSSPPTPLFIHQGSEQ